MADGYARISGKVGVVCAQNGPAATLLVPPLSEALKASVPVLAIVEDVLRVDTDRNAFQELDQISLFQSCTKWVRRLQSPERVDDYLDMAFTMATSGRPGPVALLIPRDLFTEIVTPRTDRRANLGRFPLDRYSPEPSLIAAAAKLMLQARKPLIIAGGGVHLSGAAAQVVALSEQIGAPVATTNMGKGVMDERSPLALGVFGNAMGKGSAAALLRGYASEADLVVLIGTRTNQNGTDSWRLFERTSHFIHIDVDPAEVGRNYEAMRLVGDARATLESLLAVLRNGGSTEPNRTRREEIGRATARARASQSASVDAIGAGRPDAVRPEYLMKVLDEHLGPDDIVVADASYSTTWIATYISSKKIGARVLLPRGLAGLGWGLPLGIGAKLAAPANQVVAVVGDGGFGHCWSELESAIRMDAPVTVLVLNNSILGFQHHGENAFLGAHTRGTELGSVDHAMIARGCGCVAETVRTPEEFEGALVRCLAAGKVAVIDIITDPAAYPPISLLDGQRVGGSRVD